MLAATPNFFRKLVSYLVIVILARHLSKNDIGAFFLAATLASIAALFTELGTTPYLTRRIAAEPENAGKALSEVISVRLPLLFLGCLGLNGLVALAYPDILQAVLLSTVYVYSASLYASFSAVFLGRRKVAYRTVTDIASQCVLLVLVYLAVRFAADLDVVLSCYIVANLVLLASGAFLVYSRISRFGLVWDPVALGRVVRAAAPLFVLILLSVLLFKVDTLMLGAMSSLQAVATYEAAYKFLEVSQIVVRPVPMIFLPLCARLVARHQWSMLNGIIGKVLVGAGLSGLVLGLAVGVWAVSIIDVVFGAEYASSASILQVLFLSLPAVYLAFVGSALANGLYLEHRLIRVTFVCLIVNIILNLIAIPLWGALGAAWTTLITEVLLAGWLLVLLSRHLRDFSGNAATVVTGHM